MQYTVLSAVTASDLTATRHRAHAHVFRRGGTKRLLNFNVTSGTPVRETSSATGLCTALHRVGVLRDPTSVVGLAIPALCNCLPLAIMSGCCVLCWFPHLLH